MENKILKPCPFCGGVARLAADFRLSDRDDSYPKWFVECSQCGVRTPDAFKDHIVNVWNRRKEKKMEEIEDMIELLKDKFEERDIPYILAYGEKADWHIKRYDDCLNCAVGISEIASEMSDEMDIEIDDIIAAVSELTEMHKEKKRKKPIKKIQKKICPLCSLSYGDDEDYCGCGDNCNLIRRIREGEEA